jgi:dihydroxy-acid dehydratase
MSDADLLELENVACPGAGACGGQYTANTMSTVMEMIGLSPMGFNSVPAMDPKKDQVAYDCGAVVMDLLNRGVKPRDILTRPAFDNAIASVAATGGSTNAVIHLVALAGRIGVPLCLDDFDRLGNGMPCLVDIQPSGTHLMEDFFYAGGVPAVLRELGEAGVLNRDALTVNGRSVWENVADAPCWNRAVVHPFAHPFKENAGIAVLRGNLAPNGAVIKLSAASPHLLQHRGRAVVFESIEEFHARINDEALEVDENSVMVLKNCGPRGYPGMAEVGNMPLPPKVLRKGVQDMVRISDARMSGTAYGTVVLHACPEAAAGGPLAFVQSGDMVTLDVHKRHLGLDIDDNTLAARRARWTPPPLPKRGWERLYVEHVQQADQGADLDFLVGSSGARVTRDSH